MNAIQQLDDALSERNTQTNEFIETIIAIINQSIKNLPSCTPSNSTPEVSGSVKVLKRKLDEIIGKIKDYTNIDENAAKRLVSRLELSNVKTNMDRKSPRNSQSLSGFSGSSPRLSDLDGLRFSDDSRSSYLTANSSSNSVPAYPIVKPTIENGIEEFNFNQPPKPSGGKRTRRR